MERALGAEDLVAEDEVEGFVTRVVPELYRYVLRLTGGDGPLAEDIVQETCLALFREVRAREAFRVEVGWMIVVARRRYLDQLRKSRREGDRLDRLSRERRGGGPVAALSSDEPEPD